MVAALRLGVPALLLSQHLHVLLEVAGRGEQQTRPGGGKGALDREDRAVTQPAILTGSAVMPWMKLE
jgi:hypothetical protein